MPRHSAYQRPDRVNRAVIEEDEKLMKSLDYWHTLLPYMGARKLAVKLREEGFKVSLYKVRLLMAIMAIYAIYPKKNLSLPNKEHKKYPYLLRNKVIQFPNQIWSIDITYIPMKTGFMYLTAIIDWHSRYIVGYELSDTLEAIHVVNAVKRAIEQYGVPGIINSDQGSQMTSDEYIGLLNTHSIAISMDGKGRWVDNIVIERWFRSLKTEDIYINEYTSPRELRKGIESYIEKYNYLRPHETFGYDTPSKVYFEAFSTQQVA
jgi:putative transposase